MFTPAALSASQQPVRSRVWAVCLALASVLALNGCAAVEVRLGWKVHLDKIPVTSIEASLLKGPEIAPGDKSPLVVVVTGPDGKRFQTDGEVLGKVLWK